VRRKFGRYNANELRFILIMFGLKSFLAEESELCAESRSEKRKIDMKSRQAVVFFFTRTFLEGDEIFFKDKISKSNRMNCLK